jgi:hypothetical protein
VQSTIYLSEGKSVRQPINKVKSNIIWVLGIGGWIASYALFARWLGQNDWDFFGGWYEAFTTSDFSAGLHLDLVFVTFMMIALAILDRKSLGKKWASAVVLSLSLSVSMSLCFYILGKMQFKK